MKKFTTHTYEITYAELLEAVKTVVLQHDPGANINLGTVNADKWLELDDKLSNPNSRIQINEKATILLSVEN
jgi:hypothetical protein